MTTINETSHDQDRVSMLYDAAVKAVVVWLVAHTAKPAGVALGALLSSVLGGVAFSWQVIAQTDLAGVEVGNIIGWSVGSAILIFAVKFLRSVYMQALADAVDQLAREREDRAEDRAGFLADITRLRSENDALRAQLDQHRFG